MFQNQEEIKGEIEGKENKQDKLVLPEILKSRLFNTILMFSQLVGFLILQSCGLSNSIGKGKASDNRPAFLQLRDYNIKDDLDFKWEIQNRIREDYFNGEEATLKELPVNNKNLMAWKGENAEKKKVEMFIYSIADDFVLQVTCDEQNDLQSCLIDSVMQVYLFIYQQNKDSQPSNEQQNEFLKEKKRIYAMNVEAIIRNVFQIKDEQLIKLKDDDESGILYYFAKMSETEGHLFFYSIEKNELQEVKCGFKSGQELGKTVEECVKDVWEQMNQGKEISSYEI